jgi:hypothetical protein
MWKFIQQLKDKRALSLELLSAKVDEMEIAKRLQHEMNLMMKKIDRNGE